MHSIYFNALRHLIEKDTEPMHIFHTELRNFVQQSVVQYRTDQCVSSENPFGALLVMSNILQCLKTLKDI